MSPKKQSEPIHEPKTVTTRLDRADDERLEKLLLQAKLRGKVPTSFSKSDFIREAIKHEMARLESDLKIEGEG